MSGIWGFSIWLFSHHDSSCWSGEYDVGVAQPNDRTAAFEMYIFQNLSRQKLKHGAEAGELDPKIKLKPE